MKATKIDQEGEVTLEAPVAFPHCDKTPHNNNSDDKGLVLFSVKGFHPCSAGQLTSGLWQGKIPQWSNRKEKDQTTS